MAWCKGPQCVNNAYRSLYCDQCDLLRLQHTTSHVMEGHNRVQILMCPLCEAIVKLLDG